jgi:hypothetical protein
MGWEPVNYPNLDAMLMRPVDAGMWKLHETFDGTYTIDDLLDINEVLDVRAENRYRSEMWRARNTNV